VTASRIDLYIAQWRQSPFSGLYDEPWHVTGAAEQHIRAAFAMLRSDYVISDEVAVHHTAKLESGVTAKGPIIISANCLVAAGAYLRGGVFLDENCIVGPGSELKSSLMFNGSKLAHLNFVGDTILGANVNIEAGAVIANYRNEKQTKAIRIRHGQEVIDTGVDKFGALIGDGCRIGANAVIAPGALLLPDTHVGRLELIDQYPTE
jgi:UDP-N-acetylglucosamine diphosphorylase / glucose-1-phosphate thymidylyltransferase / UDP-N-acetylgalactosamine diphosphorylase / glucosamine-1-phosphate N-acetyltransferase / galactosamine-1-phosphate N-acetyltransferase